MTAARHLVVVAAAESATSETVAEKLRSAFTVRTAYDGEGLRASLDETVDVVVLDRGLPGMQPEELSDLIDSRELFCKVALLTSERVTEVPAVADAVLDETAPVEELEHVTARMAARAAYQQRLEQVYDLAKRRADLVTRADELDEEEVAELGRIESRIDRLRGEISGVLARLDDDAAFEAALEDIEDRN